LAHSVAQRLPPEPYLAERGDVGLDVQVYLENLEAPPPPEMQQLLGAMHGNPEGMSGFVSTIAGVVSPPEFFGSENVGRIMAQTGAARSGSSLRSRRPLKLPRGHFIIAPPVNPEEARWLAYRSSPEIRSSRKRSPHMTPSC